MLAILGQQLRRSRGQVLGWGVSLAVLAAYLLSFYDTLASQVAQLDAMMRSYPPELMAFFGEVVTLGTPEGYLTLQFFSYMPLIIGIYAVLAGSGLLAGDEENGTLDLLLAHPVSRTGFFLGRMTGLVLAILAILGMAWLGFVVGLKWAEIEVTPGQLALPFLSLAAVLLVFAAFSLLMSMVLPSRRMAAMVGGLVLVASFFVTSLARVDRNLEKLARFSPLNYYQSGDAILGLRVDWLLGLVAATLALLVLAWWRFERRDLRVAGERGWGFRWRRQGSSPTGSP